MSFLHEEKTIPPDETVDSLAPDCPTCIKPMWLERIESTVGPTEKISRRHYECKRCGLSQIVVARLPL
jgi:hypothetical protein